MKKAKKVDRKPSKHELDNRSEQMNETSDKFYKARGELGRPADWNKESKEKKK